MTTSSRRSGFSLVELLTVIGIIAILAAIIFPVMGGVKENARRNNCMTNLKNISMGLDLYKKDMKSYPVALMPYVAGKPFEMAKTKQGLYNDEYVKSPSIMHCPSSGVTSRTDHVPQTIGTQKVDVYLYNSYDGAIFPQSSTDPTKYEQHYCLNWAATANDVDSVPTAGNSKDDDYQRQLCFRNPPSDTVVTWCSAHESRDLATGTSTGKVIVLFLGGETAVMDAAQVEKTKWRTKRM